jgi:hypothetical protein
MQSHRKLCFESIWIFTLCSTLSYTSSYSFVLCSSVPNRDLLFINKLKNMVYQVSAINEKSLMAWNSIVEQYPSCGNKSKYVNKINYEKIDGLWTYNYSSPKCTSTNISPRSWKHSQPTACQLKNYLRWTLHIGNKQYWWVVITFSVDSFTK